jgi:DNA-directed RNA polymerase beta subunit
MMHCIKTGEGACFAIYEDIDMKPAARIISLAAGLFAAVAAQASDTATTQVFAASIAALPAVSMSDQLHASTEALIQRQLAEISTRLTATMTGAGSETQSAKDTQLALSAR